MRPRIRCAHGSTRSSIARERQREDLTIRGDDGSKDDNQSGDDKDKKRTRSPDFSASFTASLVFNTT
jgi:hypothetical protein